MLIPLSKRLTIVTGTVIISLAGQFIPVQSRTPSPATATFTCVTTTKPPQTVMQMAGKSELNPIFSWYSEYLLPEDSPTVVCETVTKALQNKINQNQEIFFAHEKLENYWQICLVSQAGDLCNAPNSEPLVRLNTNYRIPVECFLEQREPLKCPPGRARGSVLSVPPARGYKPSWWVF